MWARSASRPRGALRLGRISRVGHVYGLGNVFAKSFRDSRRGMWIVGGFFCLMWLISGEALSRTFGTMASRADALRLSQTLPAVLQGLYGGSQPNVQTLGGFTNWRYGVIFFLMPGIWSVFTLSSTLVKEARRGSLDFVAGCPISRRRIALQKLGGHTAAMAAAMAVTGLVIWVVGGVFGSLSAADLAALGATTGDDIALGAALGYVLLLGLLGLTAGAVAFALAPFVGRGAAAGISGALMAAGWLVYGYRESIPLFERLTFLSPFDWTSGHRPIAGTSDWPTLLALVAIITVGFAIGVAAFERRDLGVVGSLRVPRVPRGLLGLAGPFGRSLADRLGGALLWGIGIGVYALLIAGSGDALRDSVSQNPAVLRIFQAAFPGVDINAPGFALQLAFLAFGYLGVGVAAARQVNSWASDEREGRLELLLSTSTGRVRWFLQSATGVFVSIAIIAAVTAIGIGIGVASAGGSALQPMAGTVVLLLYGSAVAGIGFAFGGIWRYSAAGVAGIVVAAGTMLLDIIVPALQLPDRLHDLALTTHFGEPMLGSWNLTGVGASLAIAIGGLALGAWGFSRRDLRN